LSLFVEHVHFSQWESVVIVHKLEHWQDIGFTPIVQ